MDLEKFRHTGELSDITVIIDGTEFKLHTFPLMIKSEYFKRAVASSTTAAPYVIRLDDEFPGGVQVFNQLADYFYSIPIAIDQKNLVALRSAARFTESHALETSIDKRLDEMLLLARAKCDISGALALLEHCKGEYQAWAKQTGIVRKCLECIVGSSTCGASLPFSKADRELIDHLPLEWMVQLIGLTEKKLTILPLVKHYLSVHVLHQSQPANSTPREAKPHESAFAPVMRHEDLSETTDDEKRETLDQIVNALDRTLEQMPLAWLHAAYEKAVELKCNCQSILSSCITQVILHSACLDREMKNLPDDVMDKLFERISQHKEEHTNDAPMLAKVTDPCVAGMPNERSPF
jgi:exonuclease VII small subunit